MNKAFQRKKAFTYKYFYKCSCQKPFKDGSSYLPDWNCYHLAA